MIAPTAGGVRAAVPTSRLNRRAFRCGCGFVAEANQRSAAHVAGLGMDDVGEFEFKGKRYRILAFGAGATPGC